MSSKAVKTGTSLVASVAAQQVAKRVVGGAAVSVFGVTIGAPFLISIAAGLAVEGLFRAFSDD